jgi:toxin ParE1/3/4
MPLNVLLTDAAALDLEDIYDYVAGHDAPERADQVLDRIEEAILSLSEYPERGAYPRELLALGIRQYREVFFKPYRIIYQVLGETVYVMLITDGRRDMQVLLQRRLLVG